MLANEFGLWPQLAASMHSQMSSACGSAWFHFGCITVFKVEFYSLSSDSKLLVVLFLCVYLGDHLENMAHNEIGSCHHKLSILH